ncbi:MAG TPA: sigma 54-interacting transcriptional regulator [Clostridiales bacterium]|nr:sigma 54-interacting transcriptional regulator [Clostridiales bacterium]
MSLFHYTKDNILLWPRENEITWQDLREDAIGYVVADRFPYEVYDKWELIKKFLDGKTDHAFLWDIPPLNHCVIIEGEESLAAVASRLKRVKYALIIDERGVPCSVLKAPQRLVEKEEIAAERDFLQKIFHDMEEEIFISDANGKVLYMNPHSEKVCGAGWQECVGHNVRELEQRGIFSKSMTLEVLSKHQKVEKTVEVASGLHIISTAMPIYDGEHNIEYVLCMSKDIKELSELMEKNALIEQALDDSKKEVQELQARVISQKNYIFESPSMKKVKKQIMKIAPTDVTVLIDGETGTGKEVTADLLHRLSKRRAQPLMKVNCGLIPTELLESELFGYMPGAFSGAAKEGKMGLIEAGNKGTIFLDEIGEMPLPLQVKLLEFLQDRQIMRIGGLKKIPVDVRIVAATNRNLETMVAQREFRKDLYYRLSVIPIHLQPLRERREDIQPLAKMFLQKFNHEYHCRKELKASVLEGLSGYSWPGNVRELMHVIERFVVSSETDLIGDDLLRQVLGKPITTSSVICTEVIPLMQAREELDYTLVAAACERYGSTRKAAKVLEVNQSTVVRILNKSKNS